MTEDVSAFFNRETKMNLTPIFNQYLRRTQIPTLELKFDEAKGEVSFRWLADEPKFNMPVRVGRKDKWLTIYPLAEWKTIKTPIKKEDFVVADELYYINVSKL